VSIEGEVKQIQVENLIKVTQKKAEINNIERAGGKAPMVECKNTRKTSRGKSKFCFL